MIPQSVQQKLNEIAREYGERLLLQVKVVFQKYSNTGELVQSLKLEIKPATENTAPVIVLNYEEQGYFIGYRNPQWSKLPKIQELLQWAQTKTFQEVPGYKGSSNLPEFKKRDRVIWAIAKDKQKNDTWKPKRWKREANIGQLLKDLNSDTILQGYKREFQKILTAAIEGKPLS